MSSGLLLAEENTPQLNLWVITLTLLFAVATLQVIRHLPRIPELMSKAQAADYAYQLGLASLNAGDHPKEWDMATDLLDRVASLKYHNSQVMDDPFHLENNGKPKKQTFEKTWTKRTFGTLPFRSLWRSTLQAERNRSLSEAFEGSLKAPDLRAEVHYQRGRIHQGRGAALGGGGV